MSSLPHPSTTTAAPWYSRLLNRKFLLHCFSVLALVHIVEVSAFGFILRSTDVIPQLAIYLAALVILSLVFLLLGMFSGDVLVYRSFYHVVHILAIICGYIGFFRVPPDAHTPLFTISYFSWPMSTLLAVCFFILACVMNTVYNTATGTSGGIAEPFLTFFQMHAPDAEETHEMCNREISGNSFMQPVSAFSHQAQNQPSFNEETRALLCPSPVEGRSEEDIDKFV